MYTFLLVFHIVVCLLLIFFVLIQSGKGSSLANIFGGGGMETVFGAETPVILNRITGILAIIFIVSSLVLAITPGKLTRKSILKQQIKKIEKKIPPPSENKK